MARKLALIFTFAAMATLLFAGSAQAVKVKRLMAPTDRCPGQTDAVAPVGTQEQAMLCLHNYARKRVGLGKLTLSGALFNSSSGKVGDILQCDQFSHSACGKDFLHWFEQVGYVGGCWKAAENIAWGGGELGTARSIMKSWLHSAGHRANILSRSYRQVGISLQDGSLSGSGDARVWVAHFGDPC